jgi:hypothetical protein
MCHPPQRIDGMGAGQQRAQMPDRVVSFRKLIPQVRELCAQSGFRFVSHGVSFSSRNATHRTYPDRVCPAARAAASNARRSASVNLIRRISSRAMATL